MVAEVFCWKEDEWAEELRTMGFYMGKFIYLMDAYEDYDRDKKKNCYNPLTFVQEEQAQDLDTWCRLLLTSMMSECAKSFERLPILCMRIFCAISCIRVCGRNMNICRSKTQD